MDAPAVMDGFRCCPTRHAAVWDALIWRILQAELQRVCSGQA